MSEQLFQIITCQQLKSVSDKISLKKPSTKEILMAIKYVIDPAHSSAKFSIKHMMFAKVHGGFEKMSGTFLYDLQTPANSSVDATIEVGSINTRDAQRDAHLKSVNFFDIEKYPLISFKSTRLEKSGDRMKITGDLSIHGVTKSVTLEVEGLTSEVRDPKGKIKIGASGSTKIKRKDFGLEWNAALEAGGFLVGDDVSIQLEVQFVKQA
jgi:polyisoprenoid-binding protein YceI